MAEETTKFPGKADEKENSRPAEWRPLESLRRELDRLFDDFGVGSWRSPSARGVFERRAVLARRGTFCPLRFPPRPQAANDFW
jgi:hypothetical protein